MKTPDTHFFCEDIHIGTLILDENESHHAIKVCRARIGDVLELCDGKGHFAKGLILEENAESCIVEISEILTPSLHKPNLNLAIGCLKDDALEEVVFHTSQIELNSITFLRTEFSQEPKNSDLHKIIRRSELKSLVSLKQSKKSWKTDILGPINFDVWLNSLSGNLVLCDENGLNQIPENFTNKLTKTTILIGPEGGLSEKEIQKVKNYNNGDILLLNLGNTRLRAKTAAIVSLGKFI